MTAHASHFIYRLLEARGVREAVARASNEYAVWLQLNIKLVGLSEYANSMGGNILTQLHKAAKVDGCGRRGSVPLTK